MLADITRNNLFGREQSASLRGTYGLLEQKIDLLFRFRTFEGNRNFGLDLLRRLRQQPGRDHLRGLQAGGRSALDRALQYARARVSPKPTPSSTNSNFRRVKVQASSLQVSPGEIALLSTAVRVAGPALTWIRDTRDSPLDAHRGTYTSFQEFLSDQAFGAQADFNRLDLSNSSYYGFDKGRFVLARNTRYGQERAFGTPAETS